MVAGPILVTGATGTLGRAVVKRLTAAARDVRALSRTPVADDPKQVAGDLITGHGIDAAVRGVSTIVHCATTNGKADVQATGTLVAAAKRAGETHVVYISIVGVDSVPLPYYKAKLAAERLIEDSGLPWTILRATQFHDLIFRFWTVASKLPVMPVPSISFQPVDVRDVAERLADLVLNPPAGRVSDMGGPEVRSAKYLARAYLRSTGRKRLVVPIQLPGGTFRAFRDGRHLTPQNATGKITFEQYLQPGPAR